MCVCQLLPQNRFTHYKCPKIPIKLLLKQYCYTLRVIIQEYGETFCAKNMANQSKLQLSLLEMEQHNLLLIATAYKFMHLKNLISKENTAAWLHDLNRNSLQQGAYHNLVKELQFDGQKF